MKKVFSIKWILVALILLMGWNPAYSEEAEPLDLKDIYVFGAVSGGLWSGFPLGEMIKGGKQTSLLIKGYTGVYLNPYFYLGTFGNISPGVTYNNFPEDSAFVAELGTIFGPRFFITEKIDLLVLIEFGWRYQLSDLTNINIEGLGVSAHIGIDYLLTDKIMLYINPGFLALPWGTDIDTSSWYEGYPPMFYLAAGVSFVLSTIDR